MFLLAHRGRRELRTTESFQLFSLAFVFVEAIARHKHNGLWVRLTRGLNRQPYGGDAMFGAFVVHSGVKNQNKPVPRQLVVLKQGNVGRSVT